MLGTTAFEDDLNDVMVTDPCPINFGTHELWQGDFITRLLNLGIPWTSRDLHDFLDALGTAYDSYRDLQAQLNVANDGATTMNPFDIRAVTTAYLRAGESMIDMPALVECTWDELIHALSQGKEGVFYADWGDAEWLKFESLIEGDGPFSMSALAREMGLPSTRRQGIAGLVGLYGKTIERKPEVTAIGQVVTDAVKRGITSPTKVQAMIAEAGLTPPSYGATYQRIRVTRIGLGL